MSGNIGDMFSNIGDWWTDTYHNIAGIDKIKGAQEAQRAATEKAAKDLAAAQATASAQAQAAISARRRRVTQTIYTDPLGIGTMAETARKTLTGQ